MNRMSKWRQILLSVFLSVALVLTYMAAPMLPVLGLQANTRAYAEEEPGDDAPLFELELPESGVYEMEAEEDYHASSIGWDGFGFEIVFYSKISENGGSTFYDSRYLHFEITGENADSFHFSDVMYWASLVEGKNSLYITPREGLKPGTHRCTLNIYIDPNGTRNFEEIAQSVDIEFTVTAKSKYAMQFDDLTQWDRPSQFLYLKNTGIKDLWVDPSKLVISGETGLFDVELTGEEPVRVPAGESCRVAYVGPLIDEASPGEHSIQFYLMSENGLAEAYGSATFTAGSNGLPVYADKDTVDFGVFQPGEVTENATDVSLINKCESADIPALIITGIDTPEAGIFRAELPADGTVIKAYSQTSMLFSLDPDSIEAQQNGRYEGTYVIHAAEAQEQWTWDEIEGDKYEYRIVDGGRTADIEIPVKVIVTDGSYEVVVDSDLYYNSEYSLYAREGYDPKDVSACIGVNSYYDGEAYEDNYVSDYVKFELVGADADSFTVDEEWDLIGGYGEAVIHPVEGLPAGMYEATVNMYVDPDGTGTFGDEPAASGMVFFECEEAPEYDAIIHSETEDGQFDLKVFEGYDSEAAEQYAEAVIITNTGKQQLEFNQSDITLWSRSEQEQPDGEHPVELHFEELDYPVSIAPGESIKIGEIMPVTGLATGVYEASIDLYLGDYLGVSQIVTISVLKDSPSLVLADESIDFGYLRPGFSMDTDGTYQSVRFINDGNTRFAITDVQVPENGPFGEIQVSYTGGEEPDEYTEYFNIIESGEEYYFGLQLDDTSEYAAQEGVYEGIYTITAQEIDSSDVPVDEGAAFTFEVPVRVEITDETYTVTIDLGGHGDNVVLEDVLKGTDLYQLCWESIGGGPGDEPKAEGYIFDGFTLEPLSSFNDWDEYYEAKEAFDEGPLVTEDTTAYVMWLPILEEPEDLAFTFDIPVCGDTAEEFQTNATASGMYGISENWWAIPMDEDEGAGIHWESFNGSFIGGETYYFVQDLWYRADFPYAPGDESFIEDAAVTVNGEPWDVHPKYHFLQIPVTVKHALEHVPYKEATTEEEGNIEYWTCNSCGRCFSDADGTKEITVEETVIPMLCKHEWGEGVVAAEPTCQEGGVKTYTCSICGETRDEEIPATGHDWRNTAVIKDPTCTETGCGIQTCGNNSLHLQIFEIPAIGHHPSKVEAKKATCSEEGNIEYYSCEDCSKCFSDEAGEIEIDFKDTITEKADHMWGEWTVIKAPAVGESGMQFRQCKTDSHHIELAEIPALQPKSITGATVTAIPAQTYTGKAITPAVTVTDGSTALVKGIDYTLRYENNINAGTATVTITGIGKYQGQKTASFKINPVTKRGWQKEGGEWYYYQNNGTKLTNGWAKDSVGWCWLGANGKITKSKWIKDKGEWYYLKANGYMAANEWAKDSTGWMYMAASGKITKSKWVKYKGDWYYLKANGYMATGTQTIGGKVYRFNSSGKWIQ